MGFDRKYLLCALSFAVLGMCLGIFMAATQNFTHHVTHAHILLVGFVVSFIYAVIHKLWLGEKPPRLAGIQFIAHQAGAVVMVVGLFLLFGNIVPIEKIEPVLAVASITVLTAALMMLFMVFKPTTVKT